MEVQVLEVSGQSPPAVVTNIPPEPGPSRG
jgi:hypothetical protein